MSIEEPAMLGLTAEEKARRSQIIKRYRVVAVVLVVVIAVGIGVSLIPPTQAKNVAVGPTSSCIGTTGSFSCTILLQPTGGSTLTAADIKNVLINGTNARASARATGSSVTVHASVPGANMICPPDFGCSVSPPSVGDIQINLTDGTAVVVTLGGGGIIR